jgi:hypothetical protein
LDLEGCEQLHSLMVWSDDLKELDLRSCVNLRTVRRRSLHPAFPPTRESLRTSAECPLAGRSKWSQQPAVSTAELTL